MGLHYPRDHFEAYFHLVTLLPLAGNGEIAVFQGAFHGLAVQSHGETGLRVIGKGIQVGGDGLAADPAGDADLEVHLLPEGGLVDGDFNVSVEGIARLLGQGDGLAGHLLGHRVRHEHL